MLLKKLLIADQSLLFSQRVAEAFSDNYEVRICKNGEEVLDICRYWQPDYMFLDLQLTGIDGLTILRTLHNSCMSIKTMVRTTCISSNYVYQSLAQLGVSYILPNPCTVAAAVSQLHVLIKQTDAENWNPEDEIVGLLLQLGFRNSKAGFSCICTALQLMLKEPAMQVTKTVYPQVARICGGTPERIERAIRTAIAGTWEARDDRVWQYYFPPGRNGEIAIPSNSDFLTRLVLCLQRRKAI